MEKENRSFCGFSSIEELEGAYLKLMEDYENQVKLFSEIERERQEAELPIYERSGWSELVKKFTVANPMAKDYGKRIAGIIIGDGELAKNPACLELALLKILSEELSDPTRSYESVKAFIESTPELREEIIQDYVKSIGKQPPRNISAGGATCVTPPRAPKSIKEATELVKTLFK